MCNHFWFHRTPTFLFGIDSRRREEELCDMCIAEQMGFVDHSPSSSQLQQNYHLPSAPVNSVWDPPFVIPQYSIMYDGDSTGNVHLPAPVHPHDTEFSQSNSRLLSGVTPPFVENDQREIHIATGQLPINAYFNHVHPPFSSDPSANDMGFPGNPSRSYPNEGHPHSVYNNQSESHASASHVLVCKWLDANGPCNQIINEEEIADHMTSTHLPPPSRISMKCLWDGCKLKKICRDTIIRHIRQIHLEIRRRRQS